MKDSARLLQEQLEQLEAGKPLEACLADLPEEEADLLRIGAMLREVQYPERDNNIVATQRAGLLKLAAQEKSMENGSFWSSLKALGRPRSNRLLPLAAVSSAVALLFICVLITLIGAGFAWRSYQKIRVAQNPSPSPTPVIVTQTLSPSPSAISEASPVQNPPSKPTKESTYNVFMPLVSQPKVRDPRSAALKAPQGLVQVQASDGTWMTIGTRHTIKAGQRIRTGALSSAELLFYDGSRAHLGPNTEVSVDELDAQASDGPRVVVLSQWIGETDHEVVPSDNAGSRYEVQTPSGTGEAKGTSFHVLVTSIQLSRFGVDEGSVAVTSLNVTVIVVAGQSTTINFGQPPGEPAFRITGEGEVTQTGTTWIIAGQTFETDENTVIIGNPQAGDWVFVEGRLLPDGTRVADRIVLLRRAPQNRFIITGRVETITDTTWIVAGQIITVNDKTSIKDDIESGDLVSVEGVILEGGTLLAEHIRLIEEEPGWPFHFVGVVQDIAAEAWTVSGVTITISDTTEIDEGLLVGDVVEVQGWVLDDETWLARSIERVEEKEHGFEFTGYVESIAPWVVSGIAFETRDWTEIESGIDIGDRVKVKGQILIDGTWVASEIERFDDDDEALYVAFVGRVTRKDPWVVSGIPLVVDDETVIKGEVNVGDLVKVKAQILPDGTWLARKIKRIEVESGLGCFSFSAVVVGVEGNQLVLLNGETIYPGDGVIIEGEVAVDSVILVFVCVDADGSITIVSIIVIYHPDEEPPPTPTPLPAPGDDDKITICHRPPGNPDAAHTITIGRAALEEHLRHGDTIGPCPDHDDDDHDDDDHDDDDHDDDDHNDDDHDDDDHDDDDHDDDDHDDDDHDDDDKD